MKSLSFLFVSIAMATNLVAQANNSPAASTNAAPHENRCLVPVPREGKPHERFLELNKRAEAADDKPKVAFVGDSITQGWEGSGKEVWAHYYGGREAINLGIGGDRTEHVLWRLDNGNLGHINPKVVVLLIGVNNIPDESNSTSDILAGVKAVVQKLEDKLPNAKILVLGIFPFRKEFDPQRGRALQIDQALHRWADNKSVFFIDFGDQLIEPDGTISRTIMPDYLHLTKAGYEIWAKAIEPKLAELLGEKPITSP